MKIKPFEFYVDGYFSYAEKVVSIWKNSKGFTLTEYEGRDEFYQEYSDYYAILIDKITSHPNSSPEDTERLNSLTDLMDRQMEQHTATLSMFLEAYLILAAYIDVYNGTVWSGGAYREITSSRYSFEEIENMILAPRDSELVDVPLITPRGLYGFNTFLFMYFNGLFPIGVSMNPHPVHSDMYEGSVRGTMEHDYDHYDLTATFAVRDKQHYVAYRYILDNQSTLGEGKAKGLLFALFVGVHEAGFNVVEARRVIKLDWKDWWKFFIDNTYYAPERFGIVIPTTFRDNRPIDIKDAHSESFELALVNDTTFYNAVL